MEDIFKLQMIEVGAADDSKQDKGTQTDVQINLSDDKEIYRSFILNSNSTKEANDELNFYRTASIQKENNSKYNFDTDEETSDSDIPKKRRQRRPRITRGVASESGS